MLKQINTDYLISLNFVHINEDEKEYLKKDYVAVQIFNDKNEVVDLVDISIYLEKQDKKWIISKCMSNDNDHQDVFSKHLKNNDIKELLHFDMVNSK